MIQSDALSRQEDHRPDEDHDNEDVTLLLDHLFVRVIDMDLRKQVALASAKDTVIEEALEALKGKGPFPMKLALEDWKLDEGIIMFKGKCYVPPDQDLRRKIVQQHHDNTVMGHLGRQKTLELVKRDYWWPGMYTFVNNYVKGCTTC